MGYIIHSSVGEREKNTERETINEKESKLLGVVCLAIPLRILQQRGARWDCRRISEVGR